VRDAAEQAAQVAREQAVAAAQIAKEQATVLARNAAEKAVPRVSAAVDWATPRIEKGLLAAGPAVESAAERVVPAVDAARDRIVEELLPKIIEAVNAAAVAGANAQRAAADKVSSSLESAATAMAAAPPPPSHRGRRILVFSTLAAAGAAGFAAWRRSRSTAPQWDALTTNEPAFTGGPEPTPPTLTDPGPSASMATSVTEQPQNPPATQSSPDTTTGDPVLDGLGTAEATAPGTTSPEAPMAEPGAIDEVVEVLEVEPVGEATGDEATSGDAGEVGDASTGDDPSKSTGRRRKS
jgi:hypothetical protein